MTCMRPTVYVETSVISYLTSRPSQYLVVAAHQAVTRQWWDGADKRFDLLRCAFGGLTMTSDPIVAEIHRIREQLWEQCHGSVEEMAERQRRLQQQNQGRLIDPEEWKRRRQAEAQGTA